MEHFRTVSDGFLKVGAPTGKIMNSCKSTLLSAWEPPLMMFIIGTGMMNSPDLFRYLYKGWALSLADAFAAAKETASMALAPRRALVCRCRPDAIILLSSPVLVFRIHANDGGFDFAQHVADRFGHAFAQVTTFVAIAQFDCFAFARRRTGRHHRAAAYAGGQDNVGLNSRVAA